MTPERETIIRRIHEEIESVRRYDGDPVRVRKNTPKAQEHIKKFYLEKKASFSVLDPAVVDEARKLAADSDNTLFIVTTGLEYELYTMKDEREIQSLKNRGSSGSCFIATAAYGSSFAPELLVFYRFRDEVLITSKLGSWFVKLYYVISPPIASVISNTEVLRLGTRFFLLVPMLRVAKFILRSK